MTTVIVDYESGNLHSAEKSFQRMAAEVGAPRVVVTSDPEAVARAERIVLPGVGAFGDCRAGLAARAGLFEAIERRALGEGAPFLGICVGMQMMADIGREHGDTAGFGWIAGEVVRITPSGPGLKIPHMGWNALENVAPHPVLAGIRGGRPRLLRAFLPFRHGGSGAGAGQRGSRWTNRRGGRARQPDRRAVSPREEPEDRAPVDREFPDLAALIGPASGRPHGDGFQPSVSYGEKC